MGSFQEYKKRAILPLIGLLMAAYYLLVFLPLSKRAEALDKPLERDWNNLAQSLGRTNAMVLNLAQIATNLEETKHALAALSKAEVKVLARLQPPEALKARVSAPFRLVEYQNELSQHTDELSRKAALKGIQIVPTVYDGLPQHRIDITEPNLLWAALRFAEDVLDTTVACGVTAIHMFEAPMTVSLTNAPVDELPPRWSEFPIEIEFTALAPVAAQVLQSLPLRPEELKAAGLPETSPEKGVVFIDRLVIKRQAPEKTDEVRVWLRAKGFIPRE